MTLEAKTFEFPLVLAGARVRVRARVFIHGGKALAVRSVCLLDDRRRKIKTIDFGVADFGQDGELIDTVAR